MEFITPTALQASLIKCCRVKLPKFKALIGIGFMSSLITMWEININFKSKKTFYEFIIWYLAKFFILPVYLMIQNWKKSETDKNSFFIKIRNFPLMRFFVIFTGIDMLIGMVLFFLFISVDAESAFNGAGVIFYCLLGIEFLIISAVVFFILLEYAIRFIKSFLKTLTQILTEVD